MEGVNLLPQTQVDKRCPSRKKMETNLNPTQSPILTGWQGIWSWSLRLPSLPRDVSGTQEAGVEGPLALSPPCRALSSFNTPWASDRSGRWSCFLGAWESLLRLAELVPRVLHAQCTGQTQPGQGSQSLLAPPVGSPEGSPFPAWGRLHLSLPSPYLPFSPQRHLSSISLMS